MTTRNSIVVGVFRDTPIAELTIEALKDAGFTNDEICYSGVVPGGDFFDALQRFAVGEKPVAEGEVEKNLEHIGLSENEADYYAREYAAGHPIVAVRAPGRENDAAVVMRAHGSLNNEGRVETSEDVPRASL